MKIVIPMAGDGARFKAAGFPLPKPFIDVNGAPMIQRVIENLNFGEENDYVFLVRREHAEKYPLDDCLHTATKGRYKTVIVDEKTEGAACTVLLAREHVNMFEELIIANSDQLVYYDHRNFNTLRHHANIAGSIFCFTATETKWSYVKCNSQNAITQVREKEVISDMATCGIYYWRQARDFVYHAQDMISKNDRVKGEFYIAPTYNYLINDRGNARPVVPFFVNNMYGMGTPEDLQKTLETLKDRS